MITLLWIVALILFVLGVARLLQGDILWGLVFIVLALLVGPAGVSIFNP